MRKGQIEAGDTSTTASTGDERPLLCGVGGRAGAGVEWAEIEVEAVRSRGGGAAFLMEGMDLLGLRGRRGGGVVGR